MLEFSQQDQEKMCWTPKICLYTRKQHVVNHVFAEIVVGNFNSFIVLKLAQSPPCSLPHFPNLKLQYQECITNSKKAPSKLQVQTRQISANKGVPYTHFLIKSPRRSSCQNAYNFWADMVTFWLAALQDLSNIRCSPCRLKFTVKAYLL